MLKQIHNERNDNSFIDSSYVDCIQSQLKHFIEVTQAELFSRCSVPWISNITGGLLNENDRPAPCNLSDATAQSLTLTDFFSKATYYGFPECKSKLLNMNSNPRPYFIFVNEYKTGI